MPESYIEQLNSGASLRIADITSPVAQAGMIGAAAQGLPKAPPDNMYADPMGIARLGMESYRGYWGMYPGDVRIQLEQMFGWASICENIRGRDLANLETVAMRRTIEGGQRKKYPLDANNWLSMLSDNPMPGQLGRFDFVKMVSLWLDMTPGGVFLAADCYSADEAALYPVDANNPLVGKPATFNFLEPSRMVIVLDPDILIRQYIYYSNSGVRYFEPWEICHIRNPYPSDDPVKHRIWGTCTREQAAMAIQGASGLRDYIRDLYARFKMPPVMITKTKGAWTKTERDDYTFEFLKKMGTGGTGFIFADEKVTPSVIDVGKNGAESLHLQNAAFAKEICAFYGVSYNRVVGELQGKNTSKVDKSSYNEGPLKGLAESIYQQISIFAQRYQRNAWLEHVPPADDNAEYEDKVRLAMVNMGGMSPAEYAQINGHECTNPDGDKFLLGSAYKGFDQGLAGATPAPSPEVKAEAMRRKQKRLTDGTIVATFREIDDAEEDDGHGFNSKDAAYECFRTLADIQAKHRGTIERKVSGIFGKLEKEVKRNAVRSLRALRSGDNATTTGGDQLFDADELKRVLSDECGDAVAELIADTIAAQAKDAGENPAETDWAKVIERAVEKSIDQIESCADTVKDELKELLQSLKDAEPDEIAKAITAKFEFYQDARAHNIAQTTSTSAQGFTSTQVHKELGLQTQWLDLRLSTDPRPGHLSMHRKLADSNGYFDVPAQGKCASAKMRYPGDPSAGACQVCECFIGETFVFSSVGIQKIFRAPYRGELVTLKTARGYQLTGTPNHPILTREGFIKLGVLVAGGNVLSTAKFDSSVSRNGNVNNRPSTIEEMFRAAQQFGALDNVAKVASNFYGDVPDGDVDVVTIAGHLPHTCNTVMLKGDGEDLLALPDLFQSVLSLDGSGIQFGEAASVAASRFSREARYQFFGTHGHSGESVKRGIIAVTNGYALFDESMLDCVACQSELARQELNGIPRFVTADQIVNVERSPCGHDSAPVYVYTMETESAIYEASGIIAMNCKCQTKGVRK